MQQAAEVEPVGGDQGVAVTPVQARQPGRGVQQERRLPAAVVRFGEQPVDQVQEVLAVCGRRFLLLRKLRDRLLQHRAAVLVLRQQAEVGPQPHVAAVLAQEVGGERVDGAQARAVRPPAEQRIDALPHLRGRLVGEGERQHRSVFVRFDQPRHAPRQHRSLARTRPGQHQQRPVVPAHGGPLVFVQGLHVAGAGCPIAASKSSCRV